MDWRVIVLALWGGGTVVAYGRLLWIRRQSHITHHDRRSRRDYLSAFGLFLVAICSAASIAFVLFGSVTSEAYSFIRSISLGAFLAVGILMATEKGGR